MNSVSVIFTIWYFLVFLGIRRIARESVEGIDGSNYIWSTKDEVASFFWPFVLVLIGLRIHK